MKNIWLVVLLLLCIIVLLFSNFGKSQAKVYDCSLSEISPDYPSEVKEECRRLRYEQWKYERDKNERENEKRLYENGPNFFRT